MIAIAQKIIEQKEGPFDPSKLQRPVRTDALRALIAAKQKGQKSIEAEEPENIECHRPHGRFKGKLDAGKEKKTSESEKTTVKSKSCSQAEVPKSELMHGSSIVDLSEYLVGVINAPSAKSSCAAAPNCRARRH